MKTLKIAVILVTLILPIKLSAFEVVESISDGLSSFKDSFSSKASEIVDGAENRKRDAGDRGENQAFAYYKKHTIGFSWNVYSSPHQNMKEKRGIDKYSIYYDYAFNPFFIIGGIYLEEEYEDFDSKKEHQQKHHILNVGLRINLTSRIFFFPSIGISQSEVQATVDGETQKYKKLTDYIGFSIKYAIESSDSLRIAYRHYSIMGSNEGEKINFGTTIHGVGIELAF